MRQEPDRLREPRVVMGFLLPLTRLALKKMSDAIARTDKLLVLRGLAALAVVFYHVQDAFRPSLRPILVGGFDLAPIFMPNGPMAVRVFFTLSGFLMLKVFYTNRYSLTPRGIRRFYIGRIKRIAPLYYALAALFVVFISPQVLKPENFGLLLRLATFTYDGTGSTGFIVAFWSIATEMQFYLLVPLVFLLFRHFLQTPRAILLAGVMILAIGPALRYLALQRVGAPGFNYQSDFNSPLLLNLDSFLIGGLVCALLIACKHEGTKRFNFSLLAVSALLLSPVLSYYCFRFGAYGYDYFGPTVATILTSAFIWASERLDDQPYRKAEITLGGTITRPGLIPEYLGAISYGVYLWHVPITFKLQPMLTGAGWKDFLFASAAIAGFAIIFAGASYRYIESRPAKATKKAPLPEPSVTTVPADGLASAPAAV